MNNKETLINHIEEHPKLRFKDIDGIDFPDWKIKQLNEVCAIVGGGTPDTQKSEYWDGNIEWFTPSEIGFKKYVDKSQRTITKTGLLNSSAKLLPKGTILLSTRATIGEMSISSIECATNQGFHSLIVNNKITNTEYIYYLKNIIKKYCLKYSSGNTFKEINLSMLRKCLIPIPTLQEQQKIAAFLSLIDENIEKQEFKLILLNKYKEGLYKTIFSNVSVESKVSLKDIIMPLKKTSHKSGDGKADGKYIFFTNTTSENFKYFDSYDYDEEIIIANTGGTANFKYYKGKFAAMSDCYIFKTSENTQYIYYWLDYMKDIIDRLGFRGNGIKHLDKRWFLSLTLELPSFTEQTKIVNLLNSFDFIIDKEIQTLHQLQKMKSGLLQQMFI